MDYITVLLVSSLSYFSYSNSYSKGILMIKWWYIAQAHKLPKAFSGPVKGGTGPSNVRTITLVDYQPDVCKDYKGEFFWNFQFTISLLFHSRS